MGECENPPSNSTIREIDAIEELGLNKDNDYI